MAGGNADQEYHDRFLTSTELLPENPTTLIGDRWMSAVHTFPIIGRERRTLYHTMLDITNRVERFGTIRECVIALDLVRLRVYYVRFLRNAGVIMPHQEDMFGAQAVLQQLRICARHDTLDPAYRARNKIVSEQVVADAYHPWSH